MREDGRAVNALPIKGMMREFGCIIPGDLLRKEGCHACTAGNLRELARIAEAVRLPDHGCIHPQMLPIVPLAIGELTGQRLP